MKFKTKQRPVYELYELTELTEEDRDVLHAILNVAVVPKVYKDCIASDINISQSRVEKIISDMWHQVDGSL